MEDILATSQKHSRGMFVNKLSHRYHAIKDYFIQQEKAEMQEKQEEQQRRTDEQSSVKRTSIGKLLRLAIVPRIKSIINYREGNIAILNAGLQDIEQATDERNRQLFERGQRISDLTRSIATYEREIDDLRILEKVTKISAEKEKLAKIIQQRETCRLKLSGKLAETLRTEIDSVSTDAVSMSQHDKANKANMGTVIRGVKTAARAAVGVYISKYLYREVTHQGKTPSTLEYVPGKEQIIEEEVIEQIIQTVPGMDKASVGKVTLGDIYAKGSSELSYYAKNMGNKIEDKTSYFRGIAFEYDGETFSGSDGRGFDPAVLTDVKIDQVLDGNTTLVSIVQEIMQDKTGKKFTTEQIGEMIINGEITGVDIWRSTSQEGIPMGWLNASEIIPEIIKSGTHEEIVEITRKIEKKITTPGGWTLKPGTEYTYTTTELNPVIASAEVGLGALEISDWNDLLRFTRSQESIHRRQPRILELMQQENERKSAGKSNVDGEEKETPKKATQVKIRREIKSFQRSNKKRYRGYTHFSQKMNRASKLEAQKREGVTVFEGFFGTRKADFASGYNENLLGVNQQEASTEERE